MATLDEFLEAGHVSISNLVLQHYRQVGMDNDDLALFLQIESYKSQGVLLPTAQLLARRLQSTEALVTQRLKSLLQRELLAISGQSKTTQHYDWQGLYQRLLASPHASVTQVDAPDDSQQARRQVYASVEAEFGRPLSPMELTTVGHWFDQDHFQPEMMLLAIQEAVANNVRNLRYIETILRNWQKNNIQTPNQAQVAKQQRRGQTYLSENTPPIDIQIPLDKIGRD
jgi:DNA replication protein